jgi:hypothetical protein
MNLAIRTAARCWAWFVTESPVLWEGDASPACSAIVQQFLRGSPAISPQHERAGPPPRLHPPEPPGYPAHQFLKQRTPPVRVYAVAIGHQTIIKSRHNPG